MYIRVEVVAGAREELIKKTSSDSFFVSVREKAERNQANKRVLELVRQKFGGQGIIAKIVSGHHSHSKILSIEIAERNRLNEHGKK